MRYAVLLVLPLLVVMAMVAAAKEARQEPARPNVLLLTIDDLNDWTGCLGGHPQGRTPHIDRLAEQGVLFTNAHCQAPVCNPSRTSFLLGLRPSTTGIYENRPWFRATAENRDRVTLPQYFGQHGYTTLTTGKVFHASRVDEPSFQTVGPRPGQRLEIDRQIVRDMPSRSRLWDFGPQQYPEEKFGDVVDATWAIEHLQQEHDSPFFLAVGFYRPHVPLYAPPRFFEQFPLDEITLPEVNVDDREHLPAAAIQLTENPTPPPHDWFVENDQWKPAVQAYLASVALVDAQVGRVMQALERSPHADNTVVVLLSDHGFHLGERQRWAKQSLWERSTRVPFIVRVPGGAQNERCSRPVELLSIYRTLLELCGLPPREDVEGVSIAPLLTDPQADWQHPAITTYQEGNHAVRSEHIRYIRYADGSEELYDHRDDPHEWNNLAADPAYDQTKEELAQWLPQTKHAGSKRKGKG